MSVPTEGKHLAVNILWWLRECQSPYLAQLRIQPAYFQPADLNRAIPAAQYMPVANVPEKLCAPGVPRTW